MTKNIKFISSFFNIKSIFIFLSIFTLKVNSETKIIAKNGDNLFNLSKQYGVPLKELMHKNNFNDANRILEGEIIIIPIQNDDYKPLTYKVLEGDTLYKIARDYNTNVKDIISINNLDNASYLKKNQIILLPNGSIKKQLVNKKNIKLASKKVLYHQTSKSEELSDISTIHNVSIEEIITLNKLNDQIKLNPNTKLKIRKGKASKLIKYGSLTINWGEWRYLDGNYITQAKNEKNKSFYLALNCKKRVLSNTLKNSFWTIWYFPTSNFEFKLINDFCDHDFDI